MNTLIMKKNLLTLCFALFLAFANGQSFKAWIAAAENAMISEDYYSALVYYTEALEFDESRCDLKYNTAEAARLFNAYSLAEEKYQEVIDQDGDNEFPLASFWLADVKQKLGKHEEAKMLYDLYLTENDGDDDYYSAKASKESKACSWAIDLINNPDESITVTHLDENINTPYSEFGAIKLDDDIYFSALKFEQSDSPYNPDRYIAKILKATEFDLAETLGDDINNDRLHTAHTAFNKEKTKVYYTVCHFITNNDIRCDLYSRDLNQDGSWSDEVKLPENINSNAHTTTQPNIGVSPEGDKEVVYFVSDRPGGVGKKDIWYSEILEDGYSDPINVESINTAEDDITPFYHDASSRLFFSSEGYQGLGGFDIYVAEKNLRDEFVVDMLPVPLNSSYHDIYYTINEEETEALFSSNRFGSLFLESSKEACCYDIYKADIEIRTIRLNALTFDATTELDLLEATVTIIDLKTGEERTVTSLENNAHFFELDANRDYQIITTRPYYYPDTTSISTRGKVEEELTKRIYLKSEYIELEVLTFDRKSKDALNGVSVSLYDDETNELINKLDFNKISNRFVFYIEPDRKYRIEGFKPNYTRETTRLDTHGKSGLLLKKLYLLKEDANNYLPVVLYYDNDHPNPRSLRKTTKKTYSQTYFPYINLKEKFKSEYGKPLKGEQRNIAESQIENFFEGDVKTGYAGLNNFFIELEKELLKGKRLELEIKGFASPRASNSYNKNLSERRIKAVVNEIHKYKNGFLLEQLYSENLIIRDVSYGEEQAPEGISDDYFDRRNSVYSVEASKERRVEIVRVNYLPSIN